MNVLIEYFTSKFFPLTLTLSASQNPSDFPPGEREMLFPVL